MNRTQPLLEVRDLTKCYRPRRFFASSVNDGDAYGIRALDGVSFSLNRSETLGLVGESGSGKTTCARCILGLTDPTSGNVYFDGQDITQTNGSKAPAEIRRNMQMVFQNPYSSLNPRKIVFDIVGDPLLVHGLAKKKDVEEQVTALLSEVGLSGSQLGMYPHELSGGQRQRIALARALALSPSLLVCDEPVSALDVSVQAQILNLLKDLQKNLKLAQLFISHDLAVIRHVSDRVAVMYFGRIVEAAPVDVLFSNPRHPYTEMLLEAAGTSIDIGSTGDSGQSPAGEPPSRMDPPKGCPFHPRCPRATSECRTTEPPTKTLNDGHFVRCIL